VDLTEEQIRKVTEANTFESKKKEVGRGHAVYRSGKIERNFTTVIIKTHLPIGKSGGWRSQLTVEQNDVMDEWINTELDGMDDLKLKYGD